MKDRCRPDTKRHYHHHSTIGHRSPVPTEPNSLAFYNSEVSVQQARQSIITWRDYHREWIGDLEGRIEVRNSDLSFPD